MNKVLNCEAIQPTRKPSFAPRPHLAHSLSTRKRAFSKDCVKEAESTARSPLKQLEQGRTTFKQTLLQRKNRELASSFSFSEEEPEHEYQKLLFGKFLEAKESEWLHFMHDMNKISQENLMGVVKIGESEKAVRSNRVLAHYVGVWLQNMGYGDPQTRSKLVATVRYLHPEESESAAKIATVLFDKLFQGYLPQLLQLRVLLQVCRRGWEYLAMFIGRFINVLRKHRHVREEEFIEEVEKALV